MILILTILFISHILGHGHLISENTITQNECQKDCVGNDLPKKRFQKELFECEKNPKLSIRQSLESWIKNLENPNSSWFQESNHEPFDYTNPILEITYLPITNNPYFIKMNVIIESKDGHKLYRGVMENGHLKDTIEDNLKSHPGWQGLLTIKLIHPDSVPKSPNAEHEEDDEDEDKAGEMYILGKLKNGKLHGLVQTYGILSRDPIGQCPGSIFKGLSFIGWLENGTPVGVSWRQLVGGSWLYGKVDENGEFSGINSIAILHQDLEMAMVGTYQNGILVIFWDILMKFLKNDLNLISD